MARPWEYSKWKRKLHGTEARAKRHRREGEKPCLVCLLGEREAREIRRNKTRTPVVESYREEKMMDEIDEKYTSDQEAVRDFLFEEGLDDHGTEDVLKALQCPHVQSIEINACPSYFISRTPADRYIIRKEP